MSTRSRKSVRRREARPIGNQPGPKMNDRPPGSSDPGSNGDSADPAQSNRTSILAVLEGLENMLEDKREDAENQRERDRTFLQWIERQCRFIRSA